MGGKVSISHLSSKPSKIIKSSFSPPFSSHLSSSSFPNPKSPKFPPNSPPPPSKNSSNSSRSSSPSKNSSNSSTSSSPSKNSSNSSTSSSLTHEEALVKINLLVPRLCASNNLPVVIRLLDAAFLLRPTPPLSALPFPLVFHHLSSSSSSSSSDLPFLLLSRLSRNALARPHLPAIARSLASSLFRRRQPRLALKILNFLLKQPNSTPNFDEATYRVAVRGLCRNEWAREALQAMRGMVDGGFLPREDLWVAVVRLLLKEARVREAIELRDALGRVGEEGSGLAEVAELINGILEDWRD